MYSLILLLLPSNLVEPVEIFFVFLLFCCLFFFFSPSPPTERTLNRSAILIEHNTIDSFFLFFRTCWLSATLTAFFTHTGAPICSSCCPCFLSFRFIAKIGKERNTKSESDWRWGRPSSFFLFLLLGASF